MKTSSQILAGVMAADHEGRSLPRVLCDDCAAAMPVTGVGMALMNDSGHQGVVAGTDGPALLMEELQFTLGEGPCLDASRARRPVLVPDFARTGQRRWSSLGPIAIDAGVGAIFALPLQVGAIRLGILDLYRAVAGGLDEDELAQAMAYSDAAVVILLHLQGQMTDGQGLHPQLSDPLHHRAEIHQATGIVAVQARVELAEALVMLRSRAYEEGQPILNVAHAVVAGDLRFGPHGDHDG